MLLCVCVPECVTFRWENKCAINWGVVSLLQSCSHTHSYKTLLIISQEWVENNTEPFKAMWSCKEEKKREKKQVCARMRVFVSVRKRGWEITMTNEWHRLFCWNVRWKEHFQHLTVSPLNLLSMCSLFILAFRSLSLLPLYTTHKPHTHS